MHAAASLDASASGTSGAAGGLQGSGKGLPCCWIEARVRRGTYSGGLRAPVSWAVRERIPSKPCAQGKDRRPYEHCERVNTAETKCRSSAGLLQSNCAFSLRGRLAQGYHKRALSFLTWVH